MDAGKAAVPEQNANANPAGPNPAVAPGASAQPAAPKTEPTPAPPPEAKQGAWPPLGRFVPGMLLLVFALAFVNKRDWIPGDSAAQWGLVFVIGLFGVVAFALALLHKPADDAGSVEALAEKSVVSSARSKPIDPPFGDRAIGEKATIDEGALTWISRSFLTRVILGPGIAFALLAAVVFVAAVIRGEVSFTRAALTLAFAAFVVSVVTLLIALATVFARRLLDALARDGAPRIESHWGGLGGGVGGWTFSESVMYLVGLAVTLILIIVLAAEGLTLVRKSPDEPPTKERAPATKAPPAAAAPASVNPPNQGDRDAGHP